MLIRIDEFAASMKICPRILTVFDSLLHRGDCYGADTQAAAIRYRAPVLGKLLVLQQKNGNGDAYESGANKPDTPDTKPDTPQILEKFPRRPETVRALLVFSKEAERPRHKARRIVGICC